MPSKKRPTRVKSPKKSSMASRADRHDLYQRAVQGVEAEIDFIDSEFKRLRGRLPRLIREDFCGTAFTSCEFVRRRKTNRAIGVDLCADTMAWGIENNLSKLKPEARERLELVRDDVRTVRVEPVDAVLAMNFSYYCFKERAELRRYFAHVRKGLTSRGLFFLDAYGGYDAFRELRERRPIGKKFTYVWHQASYNPIDGHTVCHIHFGFPDGSRLNKAFTYDWRMWTLPELQEILKEAGFRRVTVYWEGWDEKHEEGNGDFKPATTADSDPGWIAYILAEK